MKIWIISDTHQQHWKLKIPSVDLVIHCGDFCHSDSRIRNQAECCNFLDWWNEIKTPKLLIAGNHDLCLYHKDVSKDAFHNTVILDDSGIEINGIKFFGSSWTPTFGGGNWVFKKARGKMEQIWKNLPQDIDFLITHGPPQSILDIVPDIEGNGRQKVQAGCRSLRNNVFNRDSIKWHAFGHIHDDDGCYNSGILKLKKSTFINASVCDRYIQLVNNGHIIEI